MSRISDIRCDICNYQFKTYSKIEQHYDDYSLEDVTCYYPIPEENAHLVKNYICDNCYNNMGDIVRQLFIDGGIEYNRELETRKQEVHKKYEEEISKLEDENNKVLEITNRIKETKSILDFDSKLIKDLQRNFPYTIGATYYLDSAIDVEKRTKQNKKKVYEWAEQYNIEIDSDRYYDMVDYDTFKLILEDSIILNLSCKEVNELFIKL